MIQITYNDVTQVEDFKGDTFTLINAKKDKGKAWRLKNYWGAKLDPFALVLEDDKPVKAFYSEDCDVIESLKKYLNGKTN